MNNEKLVTDIFKLEELFGIYFYFLFICFRILFCNYEKVDREGVNIVCLLLKDLK